MKRESFYTSSFYTASFDLRESTIRWDSVQHKWLYRSDKFRTLRALKSKWSGSIDAENKFAAVMADEIRREIDQDIIESI